MPKKKKPKHTADSFFDDFVSACSVTDCTGLLPTPPRSAAEEDSYLAIYRYTPPTPEVPETEQKQTS